MNSTGMVWSSSSKTTITEGAVCTAAFWTACTQRIRPSDTPVAVTTVLQTLKALVLPHSGRRTSTSNLSSCLQCMCTGL